MVAFKDAYVVVSDCLQILHVNQEDISDTWMLKVVNGSRDVGSNAFKVVQLDCLPYFSFCQEEVEGLTKVSRVSFIMISDLFIAVLDDSNKVHELIEV